MTVATRDNILFAGLMPHPPIVVPEVAQGREREAARTVDAMRECARRVVASAARTLVLISPHSPRKPGQFGIWPSSHLTGSFHMFGAPEARVDVPNDLTFLKELEHQCASAGLETWRIRDSELDHGALVPLYYIEEAGWQHPAVVVGLNYPGEGQLQELGEAIAAAANALDKTIAIIASGDMSHRLKPSAPGGFHPQAQDFDHRFVELVKQGRYEKIRTFDEELQSLAGEDVIDSSLVAMAASGYDATNHELLSYEGPFGVGYSVAVFYRKAGGYLPSSIEAENSYACLTQFARNAVENWVRDRIRLKTPTGLAEKLREPAPVFVTIRTRGGELRGCIGNLQAEKSNVVEEVIDRAIVTATSDARFAAITEEELEDLTYEVSVLHPPEPVYSTEDLDPERFGIIIHDDHGRRAVMLPGVETLDTVEKQLSATKRKAGIPDNANLYIQRFEVEKIKERGEPSEGR